MVNKNNTKMKKVININTNKKKHTPFILDEVQYYLSSGIILHPLLYSEYINKLIELERMNKISLTPKMIFQLFHQKTKFYAKNI